MPASMRLILLAVVLCGGCVVVKPFQREYLSERAMRPASEATEDRFRAHWQESREGASGGFGAAGGEKVGHR